MPLRLSAVAAVAATVLFAPPASAAVHLSQIGTFTTPVYVTAPPTDPHRVFVVEQAGRIMEVLDGQKLNTPFLDITSDVKSGGEQGLLSMAFAPDYATSGRYYVYYTAPRANDSTGSVVTVDEISPAGRRNIFTVDHPTNANHNGGQLQFGPDGLLYAGTGDGGSSNDPPNNAQTLGVNLGKMLRVDPLSGAAPEIYAYGLRNPFRFSFDRQTGDLIIGDVGQGQREEVDFTAAGAPAGINYGWHCWEGTLQTPGISPACDPPDDVFPVLEKNHGSDAFHAIIGGYVLRDPSVPELNGRYVYGDNSVDELRSAALVSPRTTDDTGTGLMVSSFYSFGEDSCGHVYAVSGEGPVYRIDGDAFTPCPEESAPGPGPTPGPGGGEPTPGGGGSADTRAPVVRLGSLRHQPVFRLRGFRLSTSCDELCGATITGTVRVQGKKRAFTLAPVTRQLGANKHVKLTLRASRRTLAAIRAAMRRHRRVRATLSVIGRDSAANVGTAKRTVGVRR